MDSKIRIIEKPDWVSWDEIHNAIWKAHESNRNKGILMRYPTWDGDTLCEKLKEGKMFVALCDRKIVGTAALKPKEKVLWCGKGKYGYCLLDSVIPEYNGNGIYRRLSILREKVAIEMGMTRLIIDTHENNVHELEILRKNGYKNVDYRLFNDHYNVVLVKWLNSCPFSNLRFRIEFARRKTKTKLLRLLKH